jgi:hypothetical protein
MIYNNQSLNNTKTNNKPQQHRQTHITHNNGSLKNTENNNIKRIYDHNNQSLNNNNAPQPSNHSKKLQQEHEQILPHNNKSLKIAPTISKIHSKFTPTTTISTNTYHNKHSLQNRNQHQTNTYFTTSNRSKITTNINKYTP